MDNTNINSLLKLAISAHREGKLSKAERIYSQVLSLDIKNADALHNMGLLAHQCGQSQKSIAFIVYALRINPRTKQYWASLIQIAIENKFDEMAISALERSKAFGFKADYSLLPQNNMVREYLEKLAMYSNGVLRPENMVSETKLEQLKLKISSKCWKEASFSIRQILFCDPHIAVATTLMSDTLTLIATEAFENQDFKKANMFFNMNMLYAKNPSPAYLNAAITLQKMGDMSQAKTCLKLLLSDDIDNEQAHRLLGVLESADGQTNTGLNHLKKAISLNEAYFEAYVDLGNLQRALSLTTDAILNYERAITINPRCVEAYVNCMDAYESINELNKMFKLVKDFQNAFEQPPAASNLYEGIFHLRSGKFTNAKASLGKVNASSLNNQLRVRLYQAQGQLYEKLADYKHAFDMYANMNLEVQKSPEFGRFDNTNFLNSLKNKIRTLKKLPSKERSVTNVRTPNIAFLIGFPRSGTTLLDSILRSHPKIEVAEEINALAISKLTLPNFENYNFIDEVPNQTELENCRIQYTSELQKCFGGLRSDRLYIDKMPLNMLDVPYISALLPNVKFIFAMRHPLDSIISNWQQNFTLNHYMAHMYDLSHIMEFYSACMRIFEESVRVCNATVHILKYEHLVADLKSELADVMNFLNLDWHDQMLRYREESKRRQINTPSYSQVIKPIYNSSIGKWKKYEECLPQYPDDLARIIQKYGY